ncbi:hypothetical protein HanRHA438_Chr09g0414311 [Helianthus annuus]|nr:hypothetical protein HanIR_Chr09g0433611 [Helianthus annuus]KAJ0889570.1 hypothetical protein HanRHA438_Chr09g0414311 [Helianthus annuus]
MPCLSQNLSLILYISSLSLSKKVVGDHVFIFTKRRKHWVLGFRYCCQRFRPSKAAVSSLSLSKTLAFLEKKCVLSLSKKRCQRPCVMSR